MTSIRRPPAPHAGACSTASPPTSSPSRAPTSTSPASAPSCAEDRASLSNPTRDGAVVLLARMERNTMRDRPPDYASFHPCANMRATENEREECMYGFRHKVTTYAAAVSVALMVAVPEVHGGSQTGTNFTGTPDGREGWAQYFVRRGYAVYVVDQVARGRSVYWAPQPYGPVTASRFNFVEQRFVGPERFRQWPQAHLHTQWPGTGKAGDLAFDQFYASQVPSVASFARQQEVNRDALIALFDKIGPASLLTHSQSGSFSWPVDAAGAQLVKALVAAEPSGPPVHDIETTGAPDWFKDAERTKLSGLGEVPLAYDPPLGADGKLEFVRQDKPDGPDLVRCWRQQE